MTKKSNTHKTHKCFVPSGNLCWIKGSSLYGACGKCYKPVKIQKMTITNTPTPRNRTAKYAPPKWCEYPYGPSHTLAYCWGWAGAVDTGTRRGFKKLCRTCEYWKGEKNAKNSTS